MDALFHGDHESSEAVSDAVSRSLSLTLAVLVNTAADTTLKTNKKTSSVRIINQRELAISNSKVWNLAHTRARTHTFVFDYVVSDSAKLAADVATELAAAFWTQQRNCTLLTLESRGFSGTERVLLTNDKGGVILSVLDRLFGLCASAASVVEQAAPASRAHQLQRQARLPRLVFRLLNVCEEHARIDDMWSWTRRTPLMQTPGLAGISERQFASGAEVLSGVREALLRSRAPVGHWLLQVRLEPSSPSSTSNVLNIVQLRCSTPAGAGRPTMRRMSLAASSIAQYIRTKYQNLPHPITQLLSNTLDDDSRCIILGAMPENGDGEHAIHALRLLDSMRRTKRS